MLPATLFLALVGAQSAAAVIHIYGSLGKLGDNIQCSSTKFADSELADLLQLEIDSYANRDGSGNSFTTQLDLACGSINSIAVSQACVEALGTPICHKSLLPRSRIFPRNAPSMHFAKRDAYFCVNNHGDCHDIIDANTFGKCPSGYREEVVEAKGFVPGVKCEKECSPEQKSACLQKACGFRLKQCKMEPENKTICYDAMLKCDAPVPMSEKICNEDLIPYFDCSDCISYAKGKCTLNMENLQKHKKEADDNFSDYGDKLVSSLIG
ncbi:hypothetical protein PT974_10734 [Cladobotryum mycophilum]|uniref:Uncharacterized protein n=1 Tax=Cladobotryum mycophilum TaxID=491253 RepID=A0ABR0SAQ5_9HYPO